MNSTRKSLISLLAVAACAAFAAPASAGQFVYGSGDDIRVVNDDGTGDRVLIPLDAVPEAVSLSSPWVAPDGETVLFEAKTPAGGIDSVWCGFNCGAIYQLHNGQISRLSGAVADCPDRFCTGLNIDPRLGPDGTLYHQMVYAEPTWSGSMATTSTEYFTPAGGAQTELPDGECGNTDDSPQPSPTAAGEYAITNYCVGGDGWVILVQDVQGNSQKLVYDDARFTNITYRGDGAQLASVESGGDTGIWTYQRDGSAANPVVSLAFTAEQDAYKTELAYQGTSKLAFVWNHAIRTVDASCSGCTLDDAPVLLQSADVDGLAWTAKTVPGLPAQTPGGGTGGGGGGGTQDPGTTPPAGDGGGAAGPLATLGKLSTAKLAKALKAGITVPFAAPGAGKLELTARKGGKVVARGSKSVGAAGPATAKLRFTKAARKKLRKAKKVTLEVSGLWAGAAIPPTQLKLKR